jgi:predicted ATPase/class 3 adenylate cyclase
MKNLPVGTVTFLFTDIEGNTPLWERDPAAMDAAMQIHNSILRQAIEANGGTVFKTVGDEFQAAFPTAPQALSAALEAQRGLQAANWNELGPLRARMGMHTGEAHLDEHGDEYAVSHTKNRGHRVMEAGHGGQVLLSQESADLCQRTLPPGVILKDLGEHHIRNWKLPERFYQVVTPDLPKDFPQLRTQVEPKHNLPVQLTSFIGRKQAIEQVEGLLDKQRLVTIVGPGGVGKTRLAIQVTDEVAGQYRQGAFFIDLAVVREPDMVIPAIVKSLELHTETLKSLEEVLLDFLRYRHTLLVLDNCEHIIAVCAELTGRLLHQCPDLHLLTTSREILAVEGEAVFQLSPLNTPNGQDTFDLDSLQVNEAVQFFLDRARAVMPSFSLTERNVSSVVAICQQLDGIPLALELAVARLRVLSVEQIALMLAERFRLLTAGPRGALPRQQTLQASIEWSYNLLSQEEQVLFRKLSVFAGGCTLDSVQHVCMSEEVDVFSVLELIDKLVSKSLVLVDAGETPRYRMLETIREYAHHKLVEAAELTAYRDRHLDYYNKLAADFESVARFWDERIAYYKKLDPEISNLRLTLGWAIASEDFSKVEKGITIFENLFDFWHDRDMLVEMAAYRLSCLEILPRGEPCWAAARARACVLSGNPLLSFWGVGKCNLEESLETFKANGSPLLITQAQIALAMYLVVNKEKENYPEASQLAWKSIEMMRNSGNNILLAEALVYSSAILNIVEGEAIAKPLLDEGIALAVETGNIRAYISGSLTLSTLAMKGGDYLLAKQFYQEQLERNKFINCRHGIAEINAELSVVTYFLKDYSSMESVSQEAISFSIDTGMENVKLWAARHQGVALLHQGKFAQAQKVLLENIGLEPEEEIEAIPLTMTYLGGVYLEADQAERAMRLLGFGESRLENRLELLLPLDRTEYSRIMPLARERLADNNLAAIWKEGRGMTLEQAVAYAKEIK